MAAPASDWPRHFRLLLWTRWTELNLTWQTSTKFVFFNLNRIRWNLTGSMISTSSNKVCVFRADPKTKMAALASDWADTYFNFSSETAEQNSMTSRQEARSLCLLPSFLFLGPIGKGPPWPIHQQRLHIVSVFNTQQCGIQNSYWLIHHRNGFIEEWISNFFLCS